MERPITTFLGEDDERNAHDDVDKIIVRYPKFNFIIFRISPHILEFDLEKFPLSCR